MMTGNNGEASADQAGYTNGHGSKKVRHDGNDDDPSMHDTHVCEYS